MSCIPSVAVCALAVSLLSAGGAEPKPAQKTNEPPRITMAVPFTVLSGTNRIVLRGLNLTNATAVRLVDSAGEAARVEIVARGKATMPDKAEAKKVGDTQIELSLLCSNSLPRDLALCVSTPDGDSNTNLLRVISRDALFDEKEPNGSFRQPNAVRVPQVIRGAIDPASDVDVFRFEGKAGERLRLSTVSSRYGSLIDPVLTLYDAKGEVLATSDDTSGSVDSAISFEVPRDGAYLVSIIDAHDRGGQLFGYVLEIRPE